MPLSTTPPISAAYNAQAAPSANPALDAEVRRDYGSVAAPTPGQEALLRSGLADLDARANRVIPGALLPPIRQFYISDRLQGSAAVVHDPQNPGIVGIVVGAGALRGGDWQAIKNEIAHEISHDILRANPALQNDPRFQPASPEVKAELDQLHFHLPPADHDRIVGEHPFFNALPLIERPIDTAEAAYAKASRQAYLNELQCDKLGAWLSGDPAGMRRAIVSATAADGGPQTPGAVTDVYRHRLEIANDPHPTAPVREAELFLTERDMQRAAALVAPKPAAGLK